MKPRVTDSNPERPQRSTTGKTATIKDVAARAGVSVATISRFLNNPEVLLEETARRVEAVMDELDYYPRLAARNLSNRNTRTLGLLTEYLDGEFFLPLLTGMEAAAYEARYSLLISSTRHWKDSSERLLPLGPHNCDGVLVFPDSIALGRLIRWNAQKFPMLLIQHALPELPRVPRVTIENRANCCQALLHLVTKHGARRVLYLRGPELHYDAMQRYEGYLDGLRQAGLPFDPALVRPGLFNEEEAFTRCVEACDEGLVFDAVLAGDDDSALGALAALAQAGRSGLPVIGFDGIVFGARQHPPLATVLAPTEEVGALAVKRLVSILEGRTVPLETQLPCEPRFIGSCGCVPGSPKKSLTASQTPYSM